MNPHPLFPRILLHSDEELAQALGARIVKRKTIHQWPLSCVQRLLLDDGRKLVYKSQLPPTVEGQFYSKALSPLLPSCHVLDKAGDCDIMTMEWIDDPLLRDVACTEADLVNHGRRVIAQIGEIRGELPTYLDIGSARAWMSFAEMALGKVRKLIQSGRFVLTATEAIDKVWTWARSAEVVGTINRNARLIHGDLKASQIFVAGDGYRVIDWQRPAVAPPDVDLVSLLISWGINPRCYTDSITVGVFWFLFLYWAVQAQCDLLPDFQGTLFDEWCSVSIRQMVDEDAPPPPPGIPPA